ncbi:MAG: glycosyltransferase family 8 protein [Eubacterium sp.]|nr:glycosyltransferase family 8 protein [Eubacterium sp.]
MMNLLVTLDSGYVYPLCCMLRSLAKTNASECINLYVAHSTLTNDDFIKIKNAVSDADIEVYPIRLDDSLFKNAPTKSRITKETYYRIFAPLYLPRSVDKILYIDPDIIILNSLHFFYSTDFGNNLIIGAKHFDGFVNRWNRFRLSMHKSSYYINAGVMLMNIDKMREFVTEEKIFKCVKRNYFRLFLADQDVINILFDGKIKLYSENVINLDERCFKRLSDDLGDEKALSQVKKSTAIVHYNGKEKPWYNEYNGKLRCFFDMYSSPEIQRARCLDAGA